MPGISQLLARWQWPVRAAHGMVGVAGCPPVPCPVSPADTAPSSRVAARVVLGWEAARADSGRSVRVLLLLEKAKFGKQIPSLCSLKCEFLPPHCQCFSPFVLHSSSIISLPPPHRKSLAGSELHLQVYLHGGMSVKQSAQTMAPAIHLPHNNCQQTENSAHLKRARACYLFALALNHPRIYCTLGHQCSRAPGCRKKAFMMSQGRKKQNSLAVPT